jgi:hypothetical protein
MKNQMHDYLDLVKGFMRKNALLIVSVKILKILIVIFLFSCSGKPEPSKVPDTILVDSIQGNSPGDSIDFKNEDEDEDEKEENNDNPMVPQES